MIIKSKPLSPFFIKLFGPVIELVFKRRSNKLIVNTVALKPNHSYILMCNHFSFWDGFWAFYMFYKYFNKPAGVKRMYAMSVKQQMLKNKWLRYTGSFSVEPGKRSIRESFDYAAEILAEPGNMLLFYPQGKLESMHIRNIKFDEGLYEIVTRIKGDCQLIWCSNIVEYFESLRPTMHATMLDCGTNHDFDFDALKKKVNEHHIKCIESNIRYTDEGIEYKA
jgi:1-acyl-sn-glycerol-3-phosphate acyltransferase